VIAVITSIQRVLKEPSRKGRKVQAKVEAKAEAEEVEAEAEVAEEADVAFNDRLRW
jgi:hypothetical protein